MVDARSARQRDTHAPTPPGRISGTCTAPGGQPISRARINIYSSDDVLIDTQTTDRHGRYTSRLLYAGAYRVEMTVPDDGTVVSKRCQVELGQVTRILFSLA